MSYSIYERLGFTAAAANGFPAISPELEDALGALDNATAVQVLRCLDPLGLAEEEVSGLAVFRLLGYGRYQEFTRAMIVRDGRVGQLKPHHYKEMEFESTGGRRPKDWVLTRRGFLIASMISPSEFGKTSREWMCDVQEAFAHLAATHRDEALASLAAAEAAAAAARQEREEALAALAAAEAAARLDPLGCNSAHLPATADGNYTDNHDFKRLTRAFTYLCVDTLYAQGTRCANTFTGMILAVTNVHLTLPTADVSNIIATTALQRAIKERIRLWTRAEPEYSTDMTTRQLYTFCTRYLDYAQARADNDVRQTTLDGVPHDDPNVPVEMAVWVECMEGAFPTIEPLPMGKTVSLDEPLVARGDQLVGQTKITLYVNKGRLGRSQKRRRGLGSKGDVVVVVDSDSGSDENSDSGSDE